MPRFDVVKGSADDNPLQRDKDRAAAAMKNVVG